MSDLVVPAAELRDLTVARSTPVAVRVEDSEGSDVLGRLVVNFSRFDTWYEINSWWEGRFLERTVKGAFRKTIKERGPKGSGQVRTLFDHGFDFHVGDKILGVPDDVREDDDFATLEADLLDTSYNRDLAPGLRRGGYGSSFMFNVLKDEWNREPEVSGHNPEGLPERSIREIRLFEAGPVCWPANPAATSQLNAVRSDTDRLYEMMSRTDPAGVARARQRIMDLRTAAGMPADQVTGPARSAAARDDVEPACQRHSVTGQTRAQRARRIREAQLRLANTPR